MKRILILVEGQTEETFVRDVLAPYLLSRNIYCVPKIATTKRVKSGPDFKGGIVSYGKTKNDITFLLGDTDAVAVTTMIDYYGFASMVPYKESIEGQAYLERVSSLEQLFKDDVANDKFFPYLQTHEFEAMLFVSPDEISNSLLEPSKKSSIEEINSQFESPEEINDNPETIPSRRLEKLFPHYKKVVHGPLVTKRVGLDSIRAKCKHFNQWLTNLESLGRN